MLMTRAQRSELDDLVRRLNEAMDVLEFLRLDKIHIAAKEGSDHEYGILEDMRLAENAVAAAAALLHELRFTGGTLPRDYHALIDVTPATYLKIHEGDD
jgi:hypothetical protein